MLRKLCLAATIAVLGAMTTAANAQSSQPTKTAEVAGITSAWANGLSGEDVRLINAVTRRKSDEDRWMVWTAIVRNREASRDIYPGEALTNDKVLANVRVRMSIDESNRWTRTWSHLNARDRAYVIRVLRDDLATKH